MNIQLSFMYLKQLFSYLECFVSALWPYEEI